MRAFAKHLPHYMALFGILICGFSGLVLFSYDKNFQTAVAIATAAGYVSWGLVHHAIHKDLHLETILEYLVISALGLVIIFSMIVRT